MATANKYTRRSHSLNGSGSSHTVHPAILVCQPYQVPSENLLQTVASALNMMKEQMRNTSQFPPYGFQSGYSREIKLRCGGNGSSSPAICIV